MENVIYNRIALFRAERGLSRQGLADALGINHQTVGFLERGDYSPSLALAMDVSAFFNLSIEMLFSRKPFRPISEQIDRGPSVLKKQR
ncbi:MAG: helix-turn-helix transcriptional regulator [Janthinobacterium lividum]